MSSQSQKNNLFPPLNSIHHSTITRIETYGAFVSTEHRLQTLVHITQIANNKVAGVNDVVDVNEKVWVKIVAIETESAVNDDGKRVDKRKIKGSMKYVDQSSGEDLDPNGDVYLHEEKSRVLRKSQGSGSANSAPAVISGPHSELSLSLTSQIGISSGIDPMIALSNLNTFGKRKVYDLSADNGGEEDGGSRGVGGYDFVDIEDDGDAAVVKGGWSEKEKKEDEQRVLEKVRKKQEKEAKKEKKKIKKKVKKDAKKLKKASKKAEKHDKKKKKRRKRSNSTDGDSSGYSSSSSSSSSSASDFDSREEALNLIKLLEAKKRKAKEKGR